jgi:hypothetical protein
MSVLPSASQSSVLGEAACERFLVFEASLLDEGRFNEWLALFTPDAWYWVPSQPHYTYLRDPDGHRTELLLPAIQVVDRYDTPVECALDPNSTGNRWGFPPPRSWFDEAAPFTSVPVKRPAVEGEPLTLESVSQRCCGKVRDAACHDDRHARVLALIIWLAPSGKAELAPLPSSANNGS